ncbi:MAG: sugar nucleotide-binding protein [Bacteroidetes bacterium]|nr:sugar nucleotide-binding protein [Bacteroidota bacterium]
MNKNQIIVTGASGFLASNFCHLYKDEFEITGIFYSHKVGLANVKTISLDLTNKHATEEYIRANPPDGIIHLAALSNPNICELKTLDSFKTNVQATVILAEICADLDILFVFASTDLVFNGLNAPYAEEASTLPISTYGFHKVMAESKAMEIYPKSVICRLPLMYGHPYAHGESFLQPILRELKQNKHVTLFTDEYRTVISAREACIGLRLALELHGNLIHFGGKESYSRFEIGQKICDIFGFERSLLLPTRQIKVNMPARRPPDVSLTNRKARQLGWNPSDLLVELSMIKVEIEGGSDEL